jgi:hypothetical protein
MTIGNHSPCRLNVRLMKLSLVLDYDEMVATMQRLQANFKKHGMHALASRLNIAQNLLLKSVVAKALDTRVQLLHRRFPRVHNPISYNAQKLTKDVSSRPPMTLAGLTRLSF